MAPIETAPSENPSSTNRPPGANPNTAASMPASANNYSRRTISTDFRDGRMGMGGEGGTHRRADDVPLREEPRKHLLRLLAVPVLRRLPYLIIRRDPVQAPFRERHRRAHAPHPHLLRVHRQHARGEHHPLALLPIPVPVLPNRVPELEPGLVLVYRGEVLVLRRGGVARRLLARGRVRLGVRVAVDVEPAHLGLLVPPAPAPEPRGAVEAVAFGLLTPRQLACPRVGRVRDQCFRLAAGCWTGRGSMAWVGREIEREINVHEGASDINGSVS